MSPSRPHDKYFRSVFSNTRDAASLLRACVPGPLARTLRWSTLTLQPGRFVSPDWRDSEADLLFSVEREAPPTPVLLYVLLEHQSSPDSWMPLRMLNYCLQVWLRWRSRHGGEHRLPLIVPLVLYQGAEPWQYEREFATLFADAEPAWRWVPRFEHLLIDQTRQSPKSVPGALSAKLAQIAMMAAFREPREELLESATRLMGELYRAAGFEEVAKHVEYVLTTQPGEYRPLFVRALRRNVPGRGGDVMNYVEQLIERGRREGRQEGRLELAQAIDGLLERDVPWSIIEAATGIDEAGFRDLKRHAATLRRGGRLDLELDQDGLSELRRQR
ncbi:MAG: Rpn family recombination-promoting nuclease/putative transposase [Spirochaetaceae bacterium]|nr:Rpn family recombination-promoting nuclease/putative transposase [Spirochaetaceae bacterium]